VRKISNSRLRNVEARAPKPFETMTFQHVIVDANPIPGGPPIERGVCRRTRLIPGGSIEEEFAEPYPKASKLPDEMVVRHRYRRGVHELFDPPIPESQLPAEADQDAVERYRRCYKR
jgi:hypothetical protein